ncbi:MFS transporter, partial [Mesotoga sp. SC_3PWM13N19]
YALLSFTNGASALVGSLVGGFFAAYLNRFTWMVGGHRFFGIQILFFVTFVLRGVSLIFLKRVKTRKVVSVSGMVFNSAAVLANRLAARPRELIEVLVHKNKAKQRKERKNGKSD